MEETSAKICEASQRPEGALPTRPGAVQRAEILLGTLERQKVSWLEGDSAEEKSMEHGGVQIEQSLGHRGEAFGLYWGKDGSQEKVLSQERL